MSSPRTFITFASLLGGMTLLSSALLLLEPGRIDAPTTRLSAFDEQQAPELELFKVAQDNDWVRIIVHASPKGFVGENEADLNDFFRAELSRNYGIASEGAGYHFVIQNKRSRSDLLEISERWRQQQPNGVFFGTEEELLQQGVTQAQMHDFASKTIVICMIGDGESEAFSAEQEEQLIWLIEQLAKEYQISPYDIDVSDAGVLFPHARINKLKEELAQGL